MIRPDGTADDRITTTTTDAQRVPSVGTQLTIEPDPTEGPRLRQARASAIAEERDAQRRACRPERLTLWDGTADLAL